MNTYASTMSNLRDTKITIAENEIKVFSICALSSEIVEMKVKIGEKVIDRMKRFIA